ncbi:MAG: hypothetical protein R3C53_14295 [Pirellulaceae bacterium]
MTRNLHWAKNRDSDALDWLQIDVADYTFSTVGSTTRVTLMSNIEFQCPKGHKIRAKPEFAGKLAKCPSCQSVMLVPDPFAGVINRRQQLTQSGVMRILGDAPQLPPMPERMSPVEKRICPRCSKSLAPSLTVCDKCQLYVGLNIA